MTTLPHRVGGANREAFGDGEGFEHPLPASYYSEI